MPQIADKSGSETGSSLRRAGGSIWNRVGGAVRAGRRLVTGRRRRTVHESESFLPLLIQVLAGFAKLDGQLREDEVDSTLGFLRYDYPEAVYSELRALYTRALREQQDLSDMAERLNRQLTQERKIMLGVQLYDLISKAGAQQEQVMAFYSFMSQLDMTAQAIDIANQLNATFDEEGQPEGVTGATSTSGPFEVLLMGGSEKNDVPLCELSREDRLLAFRYHELVLLKNLTHQKVLVRGRSLPQGQFRRLYPGERIVMDERVITYQDIVFFFNAKKNILAPEVYIHLLDDQEVRVEGTRTRESIFAVTFGLRPSIRVLRDSNARINGVLLRKALELQVQHDDVVTFSNGNELNLEELRRRAGDLGSRMRLTPSKSQYLVSNNPSLLREGDILLSESPGGEVLLRIECDYEERTGHLEILRSQRPISVGRFPVKSGALLVDGDLIRISDSQGLRCNFSERIIEEERNVIRAIEVRDLSHVFKRTVTALDSVSFSATRGELLCIMGPSGSGKSTLLRAMAGYLEPQEGHVMLNGNSLYEDLDTLSRFIAMVPHEDSFDELLTVRENLSFSAALRAPHLGLRERDRRVESKLVELGIHERKNSIVSGEQHKVLSGGERKRLNIGLDMIGSADMYLFDEPTSGLSSKDSEHVIDILRNLAQNKIVIISIHQPSSKIFHMFDKALLMDRGGRLVFHGPPSEMLQYFSGEEGSQELAARFGEEAVLSEAMQPEYVFDVLESPLRDLGGDIIYEENEDGQRVPTRRFSPDYWRNKFESYRLIQEYGSTETDEDNQDNENPDDPQPVGGGNGDSEPPEEETGPGPLIRNQGDRQRVANRLRASNATAIEKPETTPDAAPDEQPQPKQDSTGFSSPSRMRVHNYVVQFVTILTRTFISKLRNRTNLAITGLVAPLLALLISVVLRYSEKAQYDFTSSFHIPTYVFLALVVAMFLGLTNSADDIIRDRPILNRERNLHIPLSFYIVSKVLVLSVFAVVQCVLFVAIGNAVLQVRGMFLDYLLFTSMTALSGIVSGLLISALAPDSKTAANVIPLVLIPQIILGGALIKYEEMNTEWPFNAGAVAFAENPEMSGGFSRSKMEVPWICQFIPMRWSYEALVVRQAKNNPLTQVQVAIQEDLKLLTEQAELNAEQLERLDVLKELLAYLYGLGGRSADHVQRRLERVEAARISGDWQDVEELDRITDPQYKAEQLFVNQKIADLVSKAEIEQSDRRVRQDLNVFFGPHKYVLGQEISVVTLNAVVLNTLSVIILIILYGVLHRKLRRH